MTCSGKCATISTGQVWPTTPLWSSLRITARRWARTKRYTYARRLNGLVELFDLENDPLQMTNLADDPSAAGLRQQMEDRLQELMRARNDQLVPCTSYRDWFDNQRRIVRNVYGPLRDPEAEPDWSMMV